MHVSLHDPASFLERAGPWLSSHEAENNLILGRAAASLRGAEAPLLATVSDGDRVVLGAMRAPAYRLIVTRGPHEALAALAAAIGTVFPGVAGPSTAAASFAEHVPGAVRGRRMRIHELTRVVPPRRPPGAMRLATPDDLPLVTAWCEAFGIDVGESHPPGAELAETGITSDRIRLWELDGEPVAMAASARLTPRGVAVNLVYTPPELRGHGYASAVVADLSQELLDGGRDYCCLYTDLANPISNAIYARIGYRPVCDWDAWDF